MGDDAPYNREVSHLQYESVLWQSDYRTNTRLRNVPCIAGIVCKRRRLGEAPTMALSSFRVVRCRKVLYHMMWGQGYLPFSSRLATLAGAAMLVVVQNKMADS